MHRLLICGILGYRRANAAPVRAVCRKEWLHIGHKGGREPLRFGADGVFRLLMLSDIQESAAYDPRSLRSVCALLDEAKPDLAVWGGDNCFGPEMRSLDDVKRFLDVFAAPMAERGIPWTHVFGNHDHDVPGDPRKHQALYEACPLHVSGITDNTIHGITNFLLPVYDHTGHRPVFHVWGLDSNNRADGMDGFLPGGDMTAAAKLPRNPLGVGQWSPVYFDQLMWYWNTSCRQEQLFGEKIPGLLCMHIAPHEFAMAQANPELCVKNGQFSEELDAAAFNSGLFSAVLQRGDIRTVSCGHTHRNDFEAEYCGIRLCWDGCAGYRCYGTDELRGGRLFTVREDDPWHITTRMIHTAPLL